MKVRVQGEEKTVRRVRRQSQALYVPGYIEEDGKDALLPLQNIAFFTKCRKMGVYHVKYQNTM